MLNAVFKIFLCVVAAVAGVAQCSAFTGARTDFRDETIYFAMTTRFYDGDPANNTYCWDGRCNVDDPEWRGDFKGLIEKLDYIKALGFTAVWITPVVENASGLDYHGYHAFDFGKVDPRYESEDCTLQQLIDQVHARDMKIIIDVVLQHNGNFGEAALCPMFEKDYSENPSNINRQMKLHPETVLPADYFSRPAGQQYAMRLAMMKNTDGVNHDSRNLYHHVGNNWNWDDYSRVWGQIAGDCVDLNTENPAVYNYLVDCYTKFIEMGADGFRIDTGGHIARLTFNKAFIPALKSAGEKYAHKRGGTPFFMFAEVCARAEEVIYRGENYNCSPCFYTWAETKDYAWDDDAASWQDLFIKEGDTGSHPNALSVLQQGKDYAGHSASILERSDNARLSGNTYHQPDYSKASGLNVIDFPMHWRFHSAENAFGVRSDDNLYNDATWNVTYVDSHDYGPNGWDRKSFGGGTAAWAENLDLMFTWRGIPCIFQGTEIEFRKGQLIDNGANTALSETARAYFGGYIRGDVSTTDFATYDGATGNMAATLANPLALHIQRLNLIRQAVPALRKGQYSTDGCSGKMAFKRRYTDPNTDSYVLVTISGDATFTGVENGTYIDAITGDTRVVTDGRLSTTGCKTKAAMRVYVLDTKLTPAPGKVGDDGSFLYTNTPVTAIAPGYDGNEEAGDTATQRDDTPADNTGGEEPTPNPGIEAGEATVWTLHYADTDYGTKVYAYFWDAGNGNKQYLGSWPGKVTEYDSTTGYHTITFTTTDAIKQPMIIFNNGRGGNGNQTPDWQAVNNGVYDRSGFLTTGIADVSPDTGLRITTAHGELIIESSATTMVGIADMRGVVRALRLQQGVNTVPVPQGLYMINGRKYMVW